MVTVAAMKVTESAHQTKGFEQVGGIFFDGLTSMCGWFMGEMDLSRGHGNIGGEKPPLGGPVKSGDVVFGGNNRADYGFAQQRAYQIVHNSLGIPNLCEGPVFTGLPDEVTESGVLLPSIGLKLSGSALSADAMQWFGNVAEAAIEHADNGWDIRRLYLSEFVDAQNRRHLLKNSGPGTLPKYLEDPPINPTAPDAKAFFSGFHLGHFFKLLDQALRDSLAAEDTLKDLPGMAGAPSGYGETPTIEPGTATTRPPITPATAAGPVPVMPAQAAPPVAGVAVAPSTQTPTGAPVMAPRARSRKPALTMPTNGTQAVTAPAPVVMALPESASLLPLVAPEAPSQPTPAPAPAPPVMVAKPSGTTPPPPPGMRPPQRAPGQ
jgi:hypothetical protein